MRDKSFHSLAQAAETYYEELKRFVLRRTGSHQTAADIVQETWVKAATAAVALPDNPRAYLYRMAGNLIADRARDAGRIVAHDLDGLPEDLVCPDPGAERIVAARQELAILTDAVRDLPEKCRQVFLLYRADGLSMREIAARLDISEKTVEKHIARAMVDCRRKLRAAGREL
ncbi:RNA polymerase sigma factor [Zavarzinia aquatilis]|uniref:RNA polymerase sigma factor n=1 Tax=Zavarzinia aquatilis TaxID=2211142 RepID=A0A317EFT2_9PROT|nr:RNA polymerase sigma factor [Zavarzinia aquatilis]PWR25462.1 RNA polymerase sigma factor [Zavarzinia aquatilis]